MSALLEVRELSKRFALPRGGELFAVDGVSFAIGEGESAGLVGESGCGKSTLARLIARLIDAGGGAIAFDGRDIAKVPARRFGRDPDRAKIQMVFQDAGDSLNPHFTAFDAIADPINRLAPMPRAVRAARIAELAGLCGLPAELLTRYPHQLSGGQKARVGIARALALNPRLLILDEPTSALDASVQAVILHLLDDLKRRLGLSYLFVSHDLNVVRLICSRVLVMYAGRIVESGAVAAVFARPVHPYTRALLSAIPGLGGARIRLAGEPSSPIDPDPQACRFAGHCPKVATLCREAMPALAPAGDGHLAACHFPDARAP